MDRRDFLRSSLLAAGGAILPRGRVFAAAPEAPLLKLGVVSDVHVRLAPGGRGLADGHGTDTLEKAFEYFRDSGVDAVVIAGDMADTGLRGELKAVADTWFKVFPDDRAPDGRKVERVFIYGNHDAFGLKNGAEVFDDPDAVAREAIEADPARAWDECFHEEWKPYFRKNVKGFDFFCSHWQAGVWCNGYAETGSSGCADAFRDAMAACDPSRPFFYVQHPHPRDTVYGRCAWGVDDGSATRLLSAFQQAVALSGHSHEPLTDPRSIWRGAFTSVATGSLRFLSANALGCFVDETGYENGVCNVYFPGAVRAERPKYWTRHDAPKMMPAELLRPDIRVGQVVSVYDGRIVFERREFVSGLSFGGDATVELPARPRSFVSMARAARPPEFPQGAALALERVTAKTRGLSKMGVVVEPEAKAALRLSFPAATAGGRVAEYEIRAENAGGTARTVRVCAVGGLYPERHPEFAKPVAATVALDALPVGATALKVTPLDAFGNRGSPLCAEITGAAQNTKA